MIQKTSNPETRADQRADLIAFGFIGIFTVLSWIVLSNTEQIEAVRAGITAPWRDPWLTQGTSHLAILIAIGGVPFMISRWPITVETWKSHIFVYVAGFFVFSAAHIFLMVGFRIVSFPKVLGRDATESLTDMGLWIYEMRKDAYTYLLVVSAFLTSRHMEQLRRETRAAQTDAKTTGRITLKSGGRTIFLHADDILWVEAASNYSDIHTQDGHHLVRMTLTALEHRLIEAGDMHVRIHRSYLVKRDAVREVVPTGDGRAVARLSNGEDLSVSRKYRHRLGADTPVTSLSLKM